MWLPFMILPLAAALERVPASLVQAAADLGASPRQTFRHVVVPLALPGLAAGSIFTFALTLGDYIIPSVVAASVADARVRIASPLRAPLAMRAASRSFSLPSQGSTMSDAVETITPNTEASGWEPSTSPRTA